MRTEDRRHQAAPEREVHPGSSPASVLARARARLTGDSLHGDPGGAPGTGRGPAGPAQQEEPAGAAAEDAYLVRRAQEGYLDAYAELVDRHGPRAYRVALRLLGDHHDAEDIAQESLVAAWQQLPAFQAESSFSTWLYRIVTRRALNRITRTRATSSLDAMGELADPAGQPAADAERHQAIDAVTAAVAALPPPQRVAVVLHHLEGLPSDEVARITGSTVPAVRSHLFRGRRTLAKTLAEWR